MINKKELIKEGLKEERQKEFQEEAQNTNDVFFKENIDVKDYLIKDVDFLKFANEHQTVINANWSVMHTSYEDEYLLDNYKLMLQAIKDAKDSNKDIDWNSLRIKIGYNDPYFQEGSSDYNGALTNEENNDELNTYVSIKVHSLVRMLEIMPHIVDLLDQCLIKKQPLAIFDMKDDNPKLENKNPQNVPLNKIIHLNKDQNFTNLDILNLLVMHFNNHFLDNPMFRCAFDFYLERECDPNLTKQFKDIMQENGYDYNEMHKVGGLIDKNGGYMWDAFDWLDTNMYLIDDTFYKNQMMSNLDKLLDISIHKAYKDQPLNKKEEEIAKAQEQKNIMKK